MFFACRVTPAIDSMTGRNRCPWLSPVLVIVSALFITAVLPVAAAPAADAAPSVTWNATFSLEENSKFDAVAGTADGGNIALGTALTEIFGGREDLLLVKTDRQGGEVWTQRLPDMQAASVAETADGGYIIGGYNVSAVASEENHAYQGTSFLIRTDSDGEVIWQQTLPGEKISAVRPTADGGYVIVGWLWNSPGSDDDTTAVVTRTDAGGTPIWNATFPGAAANAGVVTADGGCVIGGTKSPFTYDIGDAFLIRLDADGTVLWNRNYGVPVIFDLEETPDGGGFVYSGNYWYGLVDAEGGEIWLRNMEGFAGYAIALRPSGGYMIAGKNIMSGEGFALGTDADGAIEWKTMFPDTSVYAATTAPDGGYTLAGIRFLSPVSSAAWLAGLEEPAAVPTPAAPGFCAASAGAALLFLAARRRRRE